MEWKLLSEQRERKNGRDNREGGCPAIRRGRKKFQFARVQRKGRDSRIKKNWKKKKSTSPFALLRNGGSSKGKNHQVWVQSEKRKKEKGKKKELYAGRIER